MVAVGLDSNRARGEPARLPAPALAFVAWEPNAGAGTVALLGVGPVAQPSRQCVQAGAVGFLGVLRPPGRHRSLAAIPLPSQRRQGPRHLDLLAGGALVQSPLDQLQTPVVGEPSASHMRCERTLLAPGGVQREAVGLVDDHAALSLVAVTHVHRQALTLRRSVGPNRDADHATTPAGCL